MCKSISEVFENHAKSGNITGATFSILDNGKQICCDTVGFFDVDKTKRLKDDAIFRLASMTKPITAVAVLILRERGLVNIDKPVSQYVDFNHGGVGKMVDGKPSFVCSAREITLRDCLCHASGLGSGVVGDYQLISRAKPCDLKKYVSCWNGALLDFLPMQKQEYSPIVAFDLIACCVETVANMPYEKFLQKEIFAPLSMTETCYQLSEEQKPRLVEMCKTDGDGKLVKVDFGYKAFHLFKQGYTGGGAGLFSTIGDYVKFVTMLSNKGEYNGKRILSEQSILDMAAPQIAINDYEDWGLGVRIVKKQDEYQPLPIGSFGWSGAYGTHFWVEPTGKSAVFMLNKADVNGSGSKYSKQFERLVQSYL